MAPAVTRCVLLFGVGSVNHQNVAIGDELKSLAAAQVDDLLLGGERAIAGRVRVDRPFVIASENKTFAAIVYFVAEIYNWVIKQTARDG